MALSLNYSQDQTKRMSKRKLTRRQQWRIEKIQEERSARVARRDSLADEQLQDNQLGTEQQGLIITHFGTQVIVESINADGTRQEQRCHFRSNLGSLVTGDQVVWCPGNPMGVVVAVLPRHSALHRPDPYGDLKTVAANIDQIFIVIAPYPEAHANLIDRYLIAAHTIDLDPILIINKQDAIDEKIKPKMDLLENTYRQLGYPVIKLSTQSKSGFDELISALKDKTSVFVGQSGVGKSSLINALIPDAQLRVGNLSEKHQGTHTTTSAVLLHFPEGGDLIDSPGIREFGLWHMEPEEILDGFIEFRPYIGHCKFRDCSHSHEPGCALLKALDDEKISQSRMDSYRAILNSLDLRQ